MRRIVLLVAMTTMLLPAVGPDVAHASDSIGWINRCNFSHRAKDDPIVHFGHMGMSHRHDFYGNRSTDGRSTYRSLRRAGTTCDMLADKAAYWIPTLFLDGVPRRAFKVAFYYRSVIDPNTAVHAYPKGLKMIAGNPDATRPQNDNIVWWECGEDSPHMGRPQRCGNENIVAHVEFPECWDGVHLDSYNHRAHVMYSLDTDNGRDICPRSHPIAMPRLILRFEWRIHDGSRVHFSNGTNYGFHADFFNAWQQRRLKYLVHHCINAGRDCGTPGSND